MHPIAIDARKLQDFGIGSYIKSLLSGLAELDGPESYALLTPPGQSLPVTGERFEAITVRAGHYGILEHLSLARAARQCRARLLHCPHYVLPMLWRGPSVVTIHDLIHLLFPEYLPSKRAHLYAKFIIANAYRRASVVLTVSETSRTDLLERFGGDPDRVRVVPNSVPDIFFEHCSEEALETARKRHALPARFLLHVGNSKPHKNVARLIDIVARLRTQAEGEQLALVLVGDSGSSMSALQVRAAEAGVPLYCPGKLPVADLCHLYRLAEVFAFPSLYEGFGLPVLEAMAAGTPVVAARAASLPEVCGDGALLADPRDIEEWVAALTTVLTDQEQRTRLIARGTARAQSFRGQGAARQVLQIYREVAGD